MRARLLTAAALVLWAALASAQPAGSESPEARKAAAQSFQEGQRAFTAGDYRLAAESFEKAHQQAPRLPTLWNAARAWHRAGEPVRAANLYARYLKQAPANAPDRAAATASMRELEAKLARIELHADGFSELTLDGEKIDEMTFYVTPGTHVIKGKKRGVGAEEKPHVEAGTLTSVTLTPRPPPAATSAPPAPAPSPATTRLSPLFATVGAGITVLAGGLTVWSGLDVQSQKESFDASPSKQKLEDGKSKQFRTNVLLATTTGAAVTTAVLALFFTDWGSSTRVGLGPDGVSLGGRF